jgi:hypothetical protein
MLEVGIWWQEEDGQARRTIVKRVQGVTLEQAQQQAAKFKELNPSLQVEAMFRPASTYLS